MLQPSPPPAASPFFERLRTRAGRRTLGIGLTIAVEGLLLLLLLSLNATEQPVDEREVITVVDIASSDISVEAAERDEPEAEQRTEERPVPQPPTAQEPTPPRPAVPEVEAPPPAPAVIPMPRVQLPTTNAAPAARPAPSGKPLYGPPNRGGSSSVGDTERVGTAPNGEPLYAASWYREPRDDQLGPYLSTANGPGWGLIACRTAPDYRVEDCVGLAEYPEGSQITRAVLAAAWEFKVRPPRIGGRPQVGSWVRIRIDYGIERR